MDTVGPKSLCDCLSVCKIYLAWRKRLCCDQFVGVNRWNHKKEQTWNLFSFGCGCMNSVFCKSTTRWEQMCLVLQAATHSVPQKGLSLMKTQWSVSLGNSVAAMMAKATTITLRMKLKQKTVINGMSQTEDSVSSMSTIRIVYTFMKHNLK